MFYIILLFAATAVVSVPYAQPRIAVEPLFIEDDLIPVELHEHVVNIANEGDELLTYAIETTYVEGGAGWLAVEPLEGEVPAGEDRDIIVGWRDGDPNFRVGDNVAELRIHNNDPENEVVVVQVLHHAIIGLMEYFIPLRQGWNIISCPGEPVERRMRVIFQQLHERDSFIMAKDASGHWLIYDFNFNNMPDWQWWQGYLVKMSRPDTLAMEIRLLPENLPLELPRGWCMAAYLPDDAMSAPEAFGSLGRNLIIAKDEQGGFYMPEYDYSNMALLRRTRGYMVKLRESGELVWGE